MTSQGERYMSLFVYYGAKYGVDPDLLFAQVRAESNFDPKAVSPAGAMGLAQFMKATWREWGSGDPFNPEESIKAQARYVSWLMKQFPGELEKVLGAYNWGIGNVHRKGLARAPKETRDYIARIKRYLAAM